MAVPTVVAVGAGGGGPGAGPFTIADPAGIAADDIDILVCECNEADVIGTPTGGWAHVTGSPVVVTTGSTRLTVFWRRFVGGDTAPALSLTTGTDHIFARRIAIRGCKTTGNPWNAVASTTEVTSDTSATWPGVTTTVADCLVLEIVATGFDVASSAQLGALANGAYTNIVEQFDQWIAANSGGGAGVVSATMASAGATGASTATLANAAPKALMTLALEPEAGTTPSGTDSGTGTETASVDTGGTDKAASETGAGADANAGLALAGVAQAGFFAEDTVQIDVSGATPDGTFTETATVDSGATPIAGADSAAGSELASAQATLARAESGLATESATVVVIGGSSPNLAGPLWPVRLDGRTRAVPI